MRAPGNAPDGDGGRDLERVKGAVKGLPSPTCFSLVSAREVLTSLRLESHSEGGFWIGSRCRHRGRVGSSRPLQRSPKPVKSGLPMAQALEAFVATLALALSASPAIPLTEPVNPILQRSVSP